MLKQTMQMNLPSRTIMRRCLACLLLFAFFACLTQTAEAQRKNRKNEPTYGRIEISTNPGGYPILIDGKPAGETTSSVRLIDLPPGPHTVEVLFPNSTRWAQTINIVAGRRECIALNYRPQTVSIPAAVMSPCPYPVNVSAPSVADDGTIVTFTADVSYTGPSALNYTWTVSPPSARIVSGAGTPTITVDSTGLGRRRLTAILVVDDGSGDRNCRQTAQASTNINAPAPPPVQPRRFDEFPSVSFDDDKARLDNLAIELQNNPGSVGYIIAYGGRGGRAGQADFLGERARNYLVNTRGIDANRLVVVNGGYRERASYELWIVPQGAQPPLPTPTAQPGVVPSPFGERPRRPRRR